MLNFKLLLKNLKSPYHKSKIKTISTLKHLIVALMKI
jgi:hypothetical protein